MEATTSAMTSYTDNPTSAQQQWMRDHWAKVSRRAATAPLIVSGEDAFEETSLVQRMVAIAMPLTGKNPEILARVQGWPAHGLAYAYLEWLVGSVTNLMLFDLRNQGVERAIL